MILGRSYRLATIMALALFAAAPVRAQEGESVPPNVRAAIDRATSWLAKAQNPDGTFGRGADRTVAETGSAVTSLAVLAFMASGELPGQGPYGETINRGINCVLSQQQANGVISGGQMGNYRMYDHGISTIMLCEAYGVANEDLRPKIRDAIDKAIKLILDAQRVPKNLEDQGGWRYQPNASNSDISVSGWQLMALRGAANLGMAVPKQAIEDGVAYIRRRAIPGGGFSYVHGGGPNQARTGTGILSLELLGQHNSQEAIAGGEYLLRNPVLPRGNEAYYYAVYYCSQAANQLGGKYWTGIYVPLRDGVISRQHQDGSWPQGGGLDSGGGEVYATAMSTLALCVPLRMLPLYQR